MGRGKKFLKLVIHILDNLLMENQKVLVNINGQTEVITKDHLRMDWRTGKDYGRKIRIKKFTRKILKDSTKMIKSNLKKKN